MKVLFALASTNQMYSGVGRAIRELARRMVNHVDLTFAIDDLNPRNVRLLLEFGEREGLTVHVGPHHQDPSFCDPLNQALPGLLAVGGWDAIETVGWANPGTHSMVLDGRKDATLVYTPHDQPLWTVPLPEAQGQRVEAVHRRMVAESDVVFCDSPAERTKLQGWATGRSNCHYLPLGCDFQSFRAGQPSRKHQLLFVGDLQEVRKRFDRVIAVFERLHARQPHWKLVVIGNRSEAAAHKVPEAVQHAVELRGYVSEPALRAAYAESAGLLLMSEFEAFGLPILEALACGTPVFLAEQPATRDLFGPFRSAHFCPADDLDATTEIIQGGLDRSDNAIREALDERPKLEAAFDWAHLANRKWQATAGAWFGRWWTRPA